MIIRAKPKIQIETRNMITFFKRLDTKNSDLSCHVKKVLMTSLSHSVIRVKLRSYCPFTDTNIGMLSVLKQSSDHGWAYVTINVPQQCIVL